MTEPESEEEADTAMTEDFVYTNILLRLLDIFDDRHPHHHLRMEMNKFSGWVMKIIEDDGIVDYDTTYREAIVGDTNTEKLHSFLLAQTSFPTSLRRNIDLLVGGALLDVERSMIIVYSTWLLYHHRDAGGIGEDCLKELIRCFPRILSNSDPENESVSSTEGEIPLLALPSLMSLSCIPLLISEGIKHNLHEGTTRGGLFYTSPRGKCLMGELSFGDVSDHSRYLDVIKRLRELDLLKKEDIKDHQLLRSSSSDYRRYSTSFHVSTGVYNQSIFQYFADWDPSALLQQWQVTPSSKGSILHWYLINVPFDFSLALQSTLRHYPHDLGLLLLKHNGDTPYQLRMKLFGNSREGWRNIQECLDKSDLKHIVLRTNPATELYPFIFAAVGNASELDLVFYLLRANPLVLELCTGDIETVEA